MRLPSPESRGHGIVGSTKSLRVLYFSAVFSTFFPLRTPSPPRGGVPDDRELASSDDSIERLSVMQRIPGSSSWVVSCCVRLLLW